MGLFSWLKRSKMKREIIINVEKLETRVAVIENGRLEEFMVEHSEEERLVDSVFKGRRIFRTTFRRPSSTSAWRKTRFSITAT